MTFSLKEMIIQCPPKVVVQIANILWIFIMSYSVQDG